MTLYTDLQSVGVTVPTDTLQRTFRDLAILIRDIEIECTRAKLTLHHTDFYNNEIFHKMFPLSSVVCWLL